MVCGLWSDEMKKLWRTIDLTPPLLFEKDCASRHVCRRVSSDYMFILPGAAAGVQTQQQTATLHSCNLLLCRPGGKGGIASGAMVHPQLGPVKRPSSYPIEIFALGTSYFNSGLVQDKR